MQKNKKILLGTCASVFAIPLLLNWFVLMKGWEDVNQNPTLKAKQSAAMWFEIYTTIMVAQIVLFLLIVNKQDNEGKKNNFIVLATCILTL